MFSVPPCLPSCPNPMGRAPHPAPPGSRASRPGGPNRVRTSSIRPLANLGVSRRPGPAVCRVETPAPLLSDRPLGPCSESPLQHPQGSADGRTPKARQDDTAGRAGWRGAQALAVPRPPQGGERAGCSQPSQGGGPEASGRRVGSCVTAPRARRPAGPALGRPRPRDVARPPARPLPKLPRAAGSPVSPPPPLSGAFSPLSAAVALGLIISNLLFEDRCPCLIKTSNFESKLGLNFP